MDFSTETVGVLNKVEALCKKFYERKDIGEDNRNAFRDLEIKFQTINKILQELHGRKLDPILGLLFDGYQTLFRGHCRELESLSEKLEKPKVTDRVKRFKSILGRLEAKAKEILDFLTTIVLPKLDKEDENPNVSVDFKLVHNVPPNPSHLTLDYDSKDTYEGMLKATVLEQIGTSTARIIVTGGGGTGKTSALRGLVEDEDIKRTFSDGTLYTTLGSNADVGTIVEGIANFAELTGNKLLARHLRTFKPKEIEDRAHMLQKTMEAARGWFQGRKCLFLIDDIWYVNDIDSGILRTFRSMLSDKYCMVYTTRDQRFIEHSDKVINFLPRNFQLSRQILLTYAECDDVMMSNDNEHAIRYVLNKCAGLPLALSIVGASVRTMVERNSIDQKQSAWADYCRKLSSNQDLPTPISTVDYPVILTAVVNASLDVVQKDSKDCREQFQALCLIQKQQTIPFRMLRRLWSLGSLGETEQVVRTLNNVSLVQWLNRDEIQLHDLISDIAEEKAQNQHQRYCRTLIRSYARDIPLFDPSRQRAIISSHVDAVTAADIVRTVKSEKRLFVSNMTQESDHTWRETDIRSEIATHAQAMGVTSSYTGNELDEEYDVYRAWWLTPDDGYIHNNLCALLRGAGCRNGLKWVLSRPLWIIKRFLKGGIYHLERDLDEGRNVASGEEVIYKNYLETIAKVARRMSVTHFDGNEVEAWSHMHERLQWQAQRCQETQKFIEEIEQCALRPAKASPVLLYQAPPDPGDDVVPSYGDVLDLHQSEEIITLLWDDGHDDFMGVTQYNVKTGIRQKRQYASNVNSFQLYPVTCGAISHDAGKSALGHRSGQISLWNLVTGQLAKTFAGHDNKVSCLSFSSDGSWLVSGSYDTTVRMYHASSGKALGKPLVGHRDVVRCVMVSADGRWIVSGSSLDIRAWKIKNGMVVEEQIIDAMPEGVQCAAVNVDASRIVFGSEDKVKVWDKESGGLVRKSFFSDGESVLCMTISADGKRIVCGSDCGTILVWNMETGELVGQPLVGHTDEVTQVTMTRDGCRIVSGSDDRTVRVWE